jgi:hypothetical protein
MLALTLALALTSSPSAAALSSAHSLVLHADDEAPVEPPADAPAEQLAPKLDPAEKLKLETEYTRLERSRPSFLGSIFACSMGGVVIFWGGYIAIAGTLLSGGLVWAIGGALVALAGGALASVGAWRLVDTVRARRDINAQMDTIQLTLATF